MTARTVAHPADLAATHLDPDSARRWLALLRPAAQLVPARLLGFYFEPDAPEDPVVLTGGPDSLPGSRLLYVTGTGPAADPAVELAAVEVLTWPDREHTVLREADLEEMPDPFWEALDDLREVDHRSGTWGRQVGGWASPVQGSVELQAAETSLGRATYDDVHVAEALEWRPLLQVESDYDAGVSWGDADCLYWLARTDGTRPPRLPDDIAFTWQS